MTIKVRHSNLIIILLFICFISILFFAHYQLKEAINFKNEINEIMSDKTDLDLIFNDSIITRNFTLYDRDWENAISDINDSNSILFKFLFGLSIFIFGVSLFFLLLFINCVIPTLILEENDLIVRNKFKRDKVDLKDILKIVIVKWGEEDNLNKLGVRDRAVIFYKVNTKVKVVNLKVSPFPKLPELLTELSNEKNKIKIEYYHPTPMQKIQEIINEVIEDLSRTY